MEKGDITRILDRVSRGEEGSLGALWLAVYADVHRMASAANACESDQLSLGPSALVSEVFLRIYGHSTPVFENRRHFFGAVARAIGRVLVDHARARDRAKRGSGVRSARLTIAEHELAEADRFRAEELERLVDSISRLESDHPRAAEVVWLRFVSGLSDSEVAGIVGVSRRTVQSDWVFAKALLRRELGIDGDPAGTPSDDPAGSRDRRRST